jgi:hypothetical protein
MPHLLTREAASLEDVVQNIICIYIRFSLKHKPTSYDERVSEPSKAHSVNSLGFRV